MRSRMVWLCLVVCILASAVPVQGQQTSPLIHDLRYIADVLGVSLPSDALLPSLEGLERTVFGRAMEGTLLQRIERLRSFVVGYGPDASLMYNLNVLEWVVHGSVAPGSVSERMRRLEEQVLGTYTPSGSSLAERGALLFGTLLPGSLLPVNKVQIFQGTQIPFQLLQQFRSDDGTQSNTPIPAVVAQDIVIDGVLVIPKGTTFTVTVSYVRQSAKAGVPAEIILTPSSLYAISGQPVSIIVPNSLSGDDRTVSTVGASFLGAVILGPVGLLGGLLVDGSDVIIGTDHTLVAVVASDTALYGYPVN